MIRRPRRTLAGAALIVAVVLGAAPADGQGLPGRWSIDVRARSFPGAIDGDASFSGGGGSTITTATLALVPGGAPLPPVCLPVQDDSGTRAAVVRTTEPTDVVPATLTAPATASFSFGDVVPFCNGRYRARVTATADEPTLGDESRIEDSPAEDSVAFGVALPAPPITGLTTAVAADRAVTVTWAPPAGWDGDDGPPPDFADFGGAGYVVERAIGEGAFERIAFAARDQLTFVDTEAPADAATARYRVAATRGDGGEVQRPVAGDLDGAPVSDAQFIVVDPDGEPVPTTVPPGAGNGPVVTAPPRGGTRPPVLPNIGGPPTTVDDGFEDELPFDEDFEPGGRDAVLPEDAADFLQRQDTGGDFVGAGVLVPGAIATLLASWALHLRYLARRAAVPG